MSFTLPNIVATDENQLKVTVYHDDKPVDTFSVNANDEDKSTLIQSLLNEVQASDEGLYTITVDYKRQKYIHKIAVAIGEFLKTIFHHKLKMEEKTYLIH